MADEHCGYAGKGKEVFCLAFVAARPRPSAARGRRRVEQGEGLRLPGVLMGGVLCSRGDCPELGDHACRAPQVCMA